MRSSLLCHVIYHPQISTYLSVDTRLLHIRRQALSARVPSPVRLSTLCGLAVCLADLQREVLGLKPSVGAEIPTATRASGPGPVRRKHLKQLDMDVIKTI